MGLAYNSKNPDRHDIQMVKMKKLKLPKISKKVSIPLLVVFSLFFLTIIYTLVVGLIIKKPALTIKQNVTDSITSIQNKSFKKYEK